MGVTSGWKECTFEMADSGLGVGEDMKRLRWGGEVECEITFTFCS